MRAGLDRRRCDVVDADGWCFYDDYEYYGDSLLPFGMSLGAVGAVLPTGAQGLWSARTFGSHVDVGVLAPLGADLRLWTGWGRLKLGGMLQSGGVYARGRLERAGDVFEEGSRLGSGWWLSGYLIGAYQPHLSDEVQLWLGGRMGGHILELPVRSNGRPYASVGRYFPSGGPELGVRFSWDVLGLVIWGFADLFSPGLVQVTAALVFEIPKPPGAAF